MPKSPAILDEFGRPFPRVADRQELQTMQAINSRGRRIDASYDAAGDGDEMRNYWANTDRYDADSANSRAVREKLVSRSRYEVGNNGYADGIAQTYATHVVGRGPNLRMMSGSEGFNQMVETQWFLWSKAVQLRRKLWCMAHAKIQDGEAIGIAIRNPRVNHAIKLDLKLIETEQCQTPLLPFGVERGYIDGVRLDEFGNPLWYDILRDHPGSMQSFGIDLTPERVPANLVFHWYRMRRPNQHRAVPECASTLNCGANARRWREATIGAAESAAELNIFLKTAFQPEVVDEIEPLSVMDIHRRMLTALPQGWDPFQMKSEFPTATYESFHKALINEQARPKSMPYNVAACDSSSYNYASGRLDHQTYYAALDIDRDDCDDTVLDKMFDAWFDITIAVFGWLGGDPFVVGPAARLHQWDWPKHRVADVESEANANETKLSSGQIFLPQLFSDAGMDFEDEIAKAATAYGLTIDELRKRLVDVLLPPPQLPAPMSPPKPAADDVIASLVRQLEIRKNGLAAHANGNGVSHAN